MLYEVITFPGAATGSGGEIRDETATGRGAKPKLMSLTLPSGATKTFLGDRRNNFV